MSWLARISTNLQEVRLVLCHKNPTSQGARLVLDKSILAHSHKHTITHMPTRSYVHSLVFADWLSPTMCRRFLHKNYRQIKRLNPKLPVMVRHFQDITPVLTARYGKSNKMMVLRKNKQMTASLIITLPTAMYTDWVHWVLCAVHSTWVRCVMIISVHTEWQLHNLDIVE